MDLEKSFLKHIAHAGRIAHSGANKSAQRRRERAIERFKRGNASTLVLAHELVERVNALGFGHDHAIKRFRGH